jgi:RND family efflux transporter MFP subunit
MKNKIYAFAIAFASIAISAIVIQACTDSKGNIHPIPKVSDAIPVTVIQLEKTVGTGKITASGQITTDDETLLGFKTGGIVDAVYVKEGDKVKKGQLLARLDLTEINALVSQAKHGLEKAKRDYDRVTNLYKDSVATLEQLQNTETAFAIAREQFDAATFNKSHSEIHASADGFVLRKFVNAGQVVGVGDPIVKTNAASSGKWILKIGVSDRQWSSIALNTVANISIDAFPGRVFKASVTRKSETADQTGIFTIELTIKDEQVKLASGMFGSAELSNSAATTSWSIPYDAVLDASDDAGFVFITNDDKIAIKQPVTIESFNGQSVRITKGLENASKLIVSGSAYLTDKSAITIVK